MGFILSKFRKTKPSTKDLLEKIDKELRGVQRFQVDTEVQQKRIVGRLLIFAFLAFTLGTIAYYLFAPTKDFTWKQHLLSIFPFIIFPIIIWSLKALLAWWYQRKIVMNKERAESLRREKDRLLEDVMENETFKVAKEILEKYAPSRLLPKYLAEQQRSSPLTQGSNSPISSRTDRTSLGSRDFNEGLRRRTLAQSTPIAGRQSFGPGQPIRFSGPPGQPLQGQFARMPFRPPAIMPAPSPGFVGPSPALTTVPTGYTPMRYMMPRPPLNPVVHNRKTGWLDKLVDYMVGDGPAYRFALICRYCATHNGLATPEDFPFTEYRCVYCRQFNPARQQRPSAQTLPRNTVLIEEMESTIKSEASVTSADVESDSGNEIDDTQSKQTENTETNDNANLADSEENEDVNANANTEPVIELAGSTNDLSFKSSDLGKEDDNNIPFVDDEDEENSTEIKSSEIKVAETENAKTLSEIESTSVSEERQESLSIDNEPTHVSETNS